MNFINQLRANLSRIVLILILSAFFIGLVALLNLWKETPIAYLTRDPNAIASKPFYFGFFSQIGIFLWAATAAICFFSAKLIKRSQESLTIIRFLVAGGLLTLLLGLDDVFLIHENTEEYFGIPEKVVYATYAIFAISFVLTFSRFILKSNYILFGMALAFFGLSIVLDRFEEYLPDSVDLFLVEDGAKMIGIVSWFIYFTYSAKIALTKHTIHQAVLSNDS